MYIYALLYASVYNKALLLKDLMALIMLLLLPVVLALALGMWIGFKYAQIPTLVVKKGVVFFKGKRVDHPLSEYVLAHNNGDDRGLLALLENTLSNDMPDVVDNLYAFLKRSGMRITQDGHFLAYRAVQDKGCNHGLGSVTEHSMGGLSFYESVDEESRVQVLKINPRDVTYVNTSKQGLCRRFEIVGEYSC